MSTGPSPGPRQRLLDPAAGLFHRHGINTVGVDLISKEAGVSKRTLYQNFGSKDRLVADSLAASGGSVIDMYIPAGEESATPRHLILAVFRGLRSRSASGRFRRVPFVTPAPS